MNLQNPNNQNQIKPYHGKAKIIMLASAYGGVGKTCLAVNLSAAIYQNCRQKVCIFDTNQDFFDISHFVKLTPKEAFSQVGSGVYFNSEVGVDVVFMANKNIQDFKNCLNQAVQVYDTIIIDTAPAFNDLTLAAIEYAEIILFLGTMEYIPAVKNMKAALDTYKKLKSYDKVRTILNRGQAQTALRLAEVEKHLGTSFAYVLPNDFKTALKALKNQVPAVLLQPEARMSQAITGLADAIVNGVLGRQQDKNRLVQRIAGLFHSINR